MAVEELAEYASVFVLVVFRLAGMMLFAPLFGSVAIPVRIKALLVLILAVGIMPGIDAPAVLPESPWLLAVGIGGEMVFGLAMGMALGFVFIAAQWAGEMIGQQMGMNMSEIYDPQFGQQSSLLGQGYFMLALAIFLVVRGHHAMLRGVKESFDALPLLSVGMTPALLELVVGLFQAATNLAVQLAAPVLVTMLLVDLAMGFLSKTIPQFNIMSAGLNIRSLVGMVLLVFILVMSSDVMRAAMLDSMETIRLAWGGG